MKFRNDYNVLVIVGNWNKNIFNQEWVSKYLIPGEKLQVEIPLNFDGSPRISTDNLRIFILGNKLNFAILKNEDTNFDKIQELAYKVADYLPHTPVSAFGINFVFETKETKYLNELFKFKDLEQFSDVGYTYNKSTLTRNLTTNNLILNLSILKEKNIFVFHLNYHFDIKNLVEFKENFDTNTIIKLKNNSFDLLSDIYNIKLNQKS